MPPTTIGPYRIVRQLGEGGMGVVYEAVNDAIERRVAIKVLHAEYAKDKETASRFFDEARAVNRIEHPSLVQVSDYGRTTDDTAYLVMEFLRGESLAQRLDKTHAAGKRIELSEVIRIAWQTADALRAAHEKSIVHRDMKPDNITTVEKRCVTSCHRVRKGGKSKRLCLPPEDNNKHKLGDSPLVSREVFHGQGKSQKGGTSNRSQALLNQRICGGQ